MARYAPNKFIISEEEKKFIIKTYLENTDYSETMRLVNKKSNWLFRHLKEWGVIKKRGQYLTDKAVTGKLEILNGDHSFFEKWTPESAWVWGLWFGDGWTTNSGVAVCGNLDVITKVKKVTGSSYKILKSKSCYTIRLGGSFLKKIIETKFGISPGKKSKTMPWPKNLPNEMLPHFIRGLWDSDGSFYPKSLEKKGLDSAYCTSSKMFMEDFVDVLQKNCGTDRVRIESGRIDLKNPIKSDGSSFMIRPHRKDTKRIYDFIYECGNISHIRSDCRYTLYLRKLLIGISQPINTTIIF